MTPQDEAFWTILSTIGTLGSAVFAAISTWFVLQSVNTMNSQTREMQRSTYAGAFESVFNILQDEEIRSARRLAIRELSHEDFRNWTFDATEKAEKVIYTYDAVGVMIRNEMLPVNIVIDHWGDSIRKCWDALEKFVYNQREERNAPELFDDFEWLAIQAKASQKVARTSKSAKQPWFGLLPT